MKCDICKVREAVFFVQEVNKDCSIELHYCEECAAKKGILLNKNSSDSAIKTVMSKIADSFVKSSVDTKICRFCGTSEASVLKTGKVGCANCYKVFSNIIRKDFKVLNTNESHETEDNKPDFVDLKGTVLAGKIEILQRKLDEAVENEDYEEAAVLRDKINELKKNIF